MDELQLVRDLVTAVLAAFIGGTIAQRLGQPVLLGYLAAGIVIGPFTPGPRADLHTVQVMAEIGVAFLMFALGAEFNLGEIRRLGRLAVGAGVIQLVATTLVGPFLAPILGLTLLQGVLVGALLALSSTVVALKLLMGRGELQALHGRLTVGILLVQDIAVVPMAVILPAMAGGGDRLAWELAMAGLKAAAVLLGAYVVGARVVPWVLSHSAVPRSRELFVLGVVTLALGTALVTRYAGLSLAFGAFLAGLVVAESEYRTQVIAEVLPLRDLFASLFFVSIGMLIDPLAMVEQAGLIALLVGVTVIGKASIITAIILLLGMPGKAALMTGLSLAQMGEFSFVLARLGTSLGDLPAFVFSLILATALVSILISPFLLRAAPFLLRALQVLPILGTAFKDPEGEDPTTGGIRRHTVICGYGQVGRELAEALEKRGLNYLVIEYNPEVVRKVRAQGIPVIYGDAANPVVLEHAHLDRAALLAVLIPDSRGAELATRHARARYPKLDIVARASSARQVQQLQEAGATEVVQPEFEAGVEVIRHAMQRYGIGGMELAHLAAGRRATFYRRAAEDERD